MNLTQALKASLAETRRVICIVCRSPISGHFNWMGKRVCPPGKLYKRKEAR